MSAVDEKQRHRKMIQYEIDRYGGFAAPQDADWTMDEEERRERAALGRWRVMEDDEDRGLFANDEGELHATVVGAAQHHNEAAAFYLQLDYYDTAIRVTPFEDVEPV